jgi:2-amino-4-hydroxy-6-hydroxymethyldihydropteridine diphosphokinase
LGLGSNVGDRLANLRTAVELLTASGQIRLVGRSSVYETEPVGEVRSQPDFYNAVVAVETDLAPHELLTACKRIEQELGRSDEGVRHGPRPIDIDLLLLGDETVADENLVVPHPELLNRRFVLTPLREVSPELTLPDGRTPGEALSSIGDGQRVEQVSSLS